MKKECVCPMCGKSALRKYWGGRAEYIHSGGYVCWSGQDFLGITGSRDRKLLIAGVLERHNKKEVIKK